MSTALLLYLLYSGLMAGLCAWSAVSAAQPVDEHHVAHRWSCLLTAVATPVAVATATLAGPLGRPELETALLAVPPLAVAAVVTNTMTLQGQGWLRRLLHVPVAAWNATLAAVYLLRAGLDLAGADVATETLAVVGAHAHLQRLVGSLDALEAPWYFHMPVVLPLWLRYGGLHNLGLLAASGTSTLMLALLGLQMPWACAQVESYRDTASPHVATVRADLLVGVGVEVENAGAAWTEGLSDAAFAVRLEDLDRLGADLVAVHVDDRSAADEQVLARLTELRERTRAAGRKLAVTVDPPARFQVRPAADLAELADPLREAALSVAEAVEPDLLFVFRAPFGRLTELVAEPVTIDDWYARIAEDAAVVRRAAPAVRVGVTFCSRAGHAEELFRRLTTKGGPVDAAGLSLYGERLAHDELRGALETWRGWCERAQRTGCPVHLIDCGLAPAAAGGERAQWVFVRELLEFGAGAPAVRSVTAATMRDSFEASRGLLAAFGRERLAHAMLRRHLDSRSRDADGGSQPPR